MYKPIRWLIAAITVLVVVVTAAGQIKVEVGEPSKAILEALEQELELVKIANYVADVQQETRCTAFDLGALSTEGEVCVLDDPLTEQEILYAYGHLNLGSVDILVMRDGEVARFTDGRTYATARLVLPLTPGDYELYFFDINDDDVTFTFTTDSERDGPIAVERVEPSEAILEAYDGVIELKKLIDLLLTRQEDTHCSETELGFGTKLVTGRLCVLDDVYSPRQILYVEGDGAYSVHAGILLARNGETVRFLNNNLRLDRFLRQDLAPGDYEVLLFDSEDRSQSWTFTVEEDTDGKST